MLEILYSFARLPILFRNKFFHYRKLKLFLKYGSNFLFDPVNSIFSKKKIAVGNDVFIGNNAYLAGDITIGDNVMFGVNPTVLAGDHIFAVFGKRPRFIEPFPGQNSEPIQIEDDVWIGANVTILGGIKIGIGSVVGAGSVVVRDIPPFVIAAGNPCYPVRRIFSNDTLARHIISLGYPEKIATEIVERRIKELSEQNIPVVDKTSEYPEVIYRGGNNQ